MKLGYTLFFVDDVSKTMEFYERAFGLTKGFSHENQYGEMVTGETKLGFVCHETAGSNGFEYEKSHLTKKPSAVEIAFVARDVDTAYRRAIENGAVSVCTPGAKPWGQVVSYVRDCNGFLVEICSPME